MSGKKLPKAIKRVSAEPRQDDAASAASEPVASATRSDRPDPDEAPPSRGAESGPARQASRKEPDGSRRRWLADRIVERYATYSAAGGFIPLPIVNVGGVVAINIRLVKALSDHYGVPFERDRARAVIVGLAAGTIPSGLATAASLLVFPAASLIGLGVSSVAAAACTRSTGKIFIEHFEHATAPT